MKSIISLFTLLLVCCHLSAQKLQEVVYLNNGSVVKGEIVEQIPNKSVKVKTADGSLFVFQLSEIEKITKEEVLSGNKKGGHRGLDFSVDGGYNISTEGGSGDISAELGLGKRFSKNFYWGISSGVFIPTGDSDPTIPVASDFKLYFPLNSSSITPGLTLRTGYVFNTADDITIGTGKYKQTISPSNFIMLQIMPTLAIPLSKSIDFNLGVGYTHFIPTEGGDGSGAFTIRTGFSFHKSNIIKPEIPTRNKGFQLTFEGGIKSNDYGYNGGTGAIVCTYKFNPNISVGLGFGYEYLDGLDVDDAIEMTEQSRYGGTNTETYNFHVNEFTTKKFFIRGAYRLNDKKFSPFASCDLGMNFYSLEDPVEYTDAAGALDIPSTGIYIAPAIGLSLRTTNNSYWELKAGYTLAPSIMGNSASYSYNDMPATISCKSISMSQPFITIGYTHTFGWGQSVGKTLDKWGQSVGKSVNKTYKKLFKK